MANSHERMLLGPPSAQDLLKKTLLLRLLFFSVPNLQHVALLFLENLRLLLNYFFRLQRIHLGSLIDKRGDPAMIQRTDHIDKFCAIFGPVVKGGSQVIQGVGPGFYLPNKNILLPLPPLLS